MQQQQCKYHRSNATPPDVLADSHRGPRTPPARRPKEQEDVLVRRSTKYSSQLDIEIDLSITSTSTL
jgi:hypothetical protein